MFVAPTVENGMLTNVYGYNVITTPNMHRANQDATYGLRRIPRAKVDLDTAANNTTGSILAVRWDQWRFGYKRRMAFEIDRDAISDSTVIVVTMRVGMINRDNEAAAISYNVGPVRPVRGPMAQLYNLKAGVALIPTLWPPPVRW